MDLIALLAACGAGAVVVLVGLRRNLGETTRDGLSPNRAPEGEAPTLGLYKGEERPRGRPYSPRERRWLAGFYLLLSLASAVLAATSADERLIHVGTAAAFGIGAVLVLVLKRPLGTAGGSSS